MIIKELFEGPVGDFLLPAILSKVCYISICIVLSSDNFDEFMNFNFISLISTHFIYMRFNYVC